ncbi:autophagy-related protein 13-like [Sinocyclocheilus rhinocerous]|uniref:autophagy-related protein 13-like n=1 Tax=Sinocyclocheilus rhinocerous TaxID=307959 RepID=UPI0007B858B2|nr:PREDICTED: autophagy-related protein 13-like [Sinocyclocheilus rhinocerous]
MDSDLSSQDRKDLDKFIKFFALKTVQIIVQARLGEKISTCSSSSPTGSDWFNLAIKDIPEVTHEAKKALAGQLPGIGRSMCVEISLKTSEGDSMELETWCLEMNEKTPGEDEGGTYAGIEDSQEVCTTSFSTSPPSQCVCTVSQAHFKTPKPALMATLKVPLMGLGVSQQLYSSRLSYQTPALGTVDLCHPTAFTAGAHPHQMVVPGKEGGVPQVPAQPNHGTAAEHGRIPSCPNGQSPQPAQPTSCSSEVKTVFCDALETTFTRKVGAFVNKATTQVTTTRLDLPFAAFAPRANDLEVNDPMVHPPPSPAPSSPLQGSLHSNSSSHSGGQPQDDFVMVDFKPAFSKDDLLPMDLGTFYREFQNPPQLASLSIDVSAQSMAEDLDSLPEKLDIYEKNIDEFDAFVDTLQ